MAAGKKNAIEKRLDDVTVLWNQFAANPKARMLRWLAGGDDYHMVETFLEWARNGGSDLPDLFIRFETPFADPKRHGFALIEDLRRQYEETQTDLKDDEVPITWVCPAAANTEADVAALARCCASFAQYYAELVERLVLVFVPAQIADRSAWPVWLLSLARAGLPANVRVTVMDQLEAPILDSICQAEPERIVTIKPELNMSAAYADLARDVKGAGPGHTFRRLFVALTNAAGQGDFAAATQAATAAIAIATQEKWPSLLMAVHMALGGAYLGAAKFTEALDCYRKATQAADAALAAGDEAGPKLVLPPRFAEGAALVSAGQFAEAAPVYETTAAIAGAQQDGLMTLEAWRMAAYCHEKNKQIPPAWEAGQKALAAGAALDPEQRANSMLPFVGKSLLGLAKEKPYRDEVDAIRKRMNELVGPDWEKRATP